MISSTPPAIVAQHNVTTQARATAAAFYRAVHLRHYRDAVTYGREYLALRPHDDKFAFDLAYAELQLQQPDAASRTVSGRDAYLRKHPQTAKVWLDIAYAESRAKAHGRSIAAIDRYLQFYPGDAQARRQRAYEVAALHPVQLPAQSDADLFYLRVKEKNYAAAIDVGSRFHQAHPEQTQFALDYEYALIAVGRLDEAASDVDSQPSGPGRDAVRAALFYAYNAANEPEKALKHGREYLSAHPENDRFAIDMAYTDLALNRMQDARSVLAAHSQYFRDHPADASVWLNASYKEAAQKNYRQAVGAIDTYLQYQPSDSAAARQRTYYVYDIWSGPRFQTYGYGQYESRFGDEFFGLDARYMLAPGVVQPYLVTHIVGDTRSGAPGTPQIFSDNAVILDGGFRARITPNAFFFAEAGTGIGTRGQGTITDLRYGFIYSQRWGAAAYTEADASAALYSRYNANVISYTTVYHVFGNNRQTIRPILGFNGALDRKSVFGNNFGEAFAGVQIGNGAMAIRVVDAAGAYFRQSGVVGTPNSYNSLRATLVFGASR